MRGAEVGLGRGGRRPLSWRGSRYWDRLLGRVSVLGTL